MSSPLSPSDELAGRRIVLTPGLPHPGPPHRTRDFAERQAFVIWEDSPSPEQPSQQDPHLNPLANFPETPSTQAAHALEGLMLRSHHHTDPTNFDDEPRIGAADPTMVIFAARASSDLEDSPAIPNPGSAPSRTALMLPPLRPFPRHTSPSMAQDMGSNDDTVPPVAPGARLTHQSARVHEQYIQWRIFRSRPPVSNPEQRVPNRHLSITASPSLAADSRPELTKDSAMALSTPAATSAGFLMPSLSPMPTGPMMAIFGSIETEISTADETFLPPTRPTTPNTTSTASSPTDTTPPPQATPNPTKMTELEGTAQRVQAGRHSAAPNISWLFRSSLPSILLDTPTSSPISLIPPPSSAIFTSSPMEIFSFIEQEMSMADDDAVLPPTRRTTPQSTKTATPSSPTDTTPPPLTRPNPTEMIMTELVMPSSPAAIDTSPPAAKFRSIEDEMVTPDENIGFMPANITRPATPTPTTAQIAATAALFSSMDTSLLRAATTSPSRMCVTTENDDSVLTTASGSALRAPATPRRHLRRSIRVDSGTSRRTDLRSHTSLSGGGRYELRKRKRGE